MTKRPVIDREKLEEAYSRACDYPSDIQAHCPTLYRLASECSHVTEFGIRYATSTAALLAGCLHGSLKKMVSYDIHLLGYEIPLQKYSGGILECIQADSGSVQISQTDLLFIDSLHTGRHLRKELKQAVNVRKWIVLHDTTLFGTNGEDGRIGLMPIVDIFLRNNPEWEISERYTHCNGLLVLKRRINQ